MPQKKSVVGPRGWSRYYVFEVGWNCHTYVWSTKKPPAMWISRSSWCIFNLEESLMFKHLNIFGSQRWKSISSIAGKGQLQTTGRKACFFLNIKLEYLGWSQKDHCLWTVVCRLGCIIANPHGLFRSAPRMLSHMFQDNFFFLKPFRVMFLAGIPTWSDIGGVFVLDKKCSK